MSTLLDSNVTQRKIQVSFFTVPKKYSRSFSAQNHINSHIQWHRRTSKTGGLQACTNPNSELSAQVALRKPNAIAAGGDGLLTYAPKAVKAVGRRCGNWEVCDGVALARFELLQQVRTSSPGRMLHRGFYNAYAV